ncbi:hypothetical protein ABH908_000005 [Pseudomonas frederiksbergensis]|uniref:hypothetical protein n=1 Tax=Pseudomonas TaxID=286 RepID=UPI003D21808D
MEVIRFDSSIRDSIQIPRGVQLLEQEISAPTFTCDGICELPAPFDLAQDWVLFTQQWPHREPGHRAVEIHLAIYADHSFEMVCDKKRSNTSLGIFSGTLYVRDPAQLCWTRQNNPYGLTYVGLRWVVSRSDLAKEWQRLADGLSALTPGIPITA